MKSTYRFCASCKCLHDASAWPHQAEAAEPKYDPAATYDSYLNGPKAGTFRKCQACGDLHEVSNWPANHMPEQFDLAHEYAGIATISDSLENYGLNGIQCQASGLMFTSKKKLRNEYRARNMIEMGSDKPPPFKRPKPDRKKIKEAVHRAFNAVKNEGAKTENFTRQRKAHEQTAFGRISSRKGA